VRLVVLFALAACGPAQPTNTTGRMPAGVADFGGCNPAVEQDPCTLIDDCCGCERGGKRLAVHRDTGVKEWESRRTWRCAETACPKKPGTDASCASAAHAVCAVNQCELAR
jgi:hypothetical protein